jgi:D-glycero-D-manno-heptose 1,7-bisphosphate phosphatase
VFLDRDGTLMRDVDYCGDPKDVQVLPGAPEALRKLRRAGFKVIVVTNQSGIGRGFFDDAQYRQVEAELARQLGADMIDATYYCPHHPDDACVCRKPSPEMIFRAARDHHIDLTRSYFIGDKTSDIVSGRNAAVKTVLVRTGYGNDTDAGTADFAVADMAAAADVILRGSDET